MSYWVVLSIQQKSALSASIFLLFLIFCGGGLSRTSRDSTAPVSACVFEGNSSSLQSEPEKIDGMSGIAGKVSHSPPSCHLKKARVPDQIPIYAGAEMSAGHL